MAGIFDEVYNYLQAPANARKANEAARADAMSNAPKFTDLNNYKVNDRLAPSNPYPLALNPGAATSRVGAKMGTELFGPPIGGNVASRMDDEAIARLAGPAPAKGTPAYASWLAAGRAAFYNAMNGGLNVKADMPIDSDLPLNMIGPPMASQSAPGRRNSMGISLGSLPPMIRGSSTGTYYPIGQVGTAGAYKYVATPNGFVNVGASGPGSSADRYAALTGGPGSVAEMERRHSGNQSSGGGPASGGEYASGGR